MEKISLTSEEILEMYGSLDDFKEEQRRCALACLEAVEARQSENVKAGLLLPGNPDLLMSLPGFWNKFKQPFSRTRQAKAG